MTALLLLLVCALPCAISMTLEEEIPDNTLKVTFQNIDKKRWSKDGSGAIFRDEVTNLTNSHCSQVPADCSLNSYNDTIPFTTSNVILDPSYPKEILGNDLEMKFYVTLAGQTDIRPAGTDHVIGIETLKDILISGQERLQDVLGYQLMYVGSTLVLPPIDHTMDIIMIPITFCLLLIVILIAVILFCCHSREENNEFEQIRKSSKVSPSPSSMEEGQKDPATNTTYKTKKERKKKVKKPKHDSGHSGEDNDGYALTPRGEPEKEYNIKPHSPVKNGSSYDDNLDMNNSKQYKEYDGSKHLDTQEQEDPKHADRYNSDDHDHSRRHKKKKKKHHRGRKHRDTSSETDPEVGYTQLASGRLPPLSEPGLPTTEL
ncbi:uncharacterized protein LOC144444460 [Glandiceps talaboti]